MLLPYAPWLAWILPFIGSALTPLLSRTNSKRSNHVAIASIGFSALFSLSMIPDILAGSVVDWRFPWMPFEMCVLVDPLNVVMACVVSVVGLLVALFSMGYMNGEPSIARFWFLIQLFIGGYMVIVLSDNLLLTFIGWEVVGLCCMTLASFWYRDPYKAHVGLKTGMILRVGDLALLASILVIYVYSGTFNIMELQQNTDWAVQLSRSGFLLITTILFLVGVVGKAAQFPLQEWLPDMLVTSPSCFNALTECLAGPFLLARLLPVFHNVYTAGVGELSIFFLATAWIGIITALVTALMATAQRNIFKILACSVSSVIGYMLTALGLAGLSGDLAPGYLAGTFLLTVDAFITALLFITAASISYAVGSDDIRDLAGVKSKLAHRGMEVGIFAMISIPPLSGFWCTNWIQTVALDLAGEASKTGQHMLMFSGYLLFLLLIIAGGITAFYGLRMMWTIFGKGVHGSEGKKLREIPDLMRFSFIAMLVVTMLIDFSVPLLIPAFNRLFLPIVHKRFLENVFEVGWYIIPSISTVMTLVALALGAYSAYQIYITRKVNPERLMAKHPFLRKTHQALLNRLYMDAFYHRIAYRTISISRVQERLERGIDTLNGLIASCILSAARTSYKYEVKGISQLQIKGVNELFGTLSQHMLSISQWAYPRIELKGFEGFNEALNKGVTYLSEKVGDTHTGVLSYNMLAVLVGIILLAILLLIYGGILGVLT